MGYYFHMADYVARRKIHKGDRIDPCYVSKNVNIHLFCGIELYIYINLQA